ncbi:MAG: PIN domain-containing protein [Candidatus Methanoperedens sp.]|nr:PIN domain-containing protein [Candidatus Methanoperedens sp.]
MAKEIIYWDSCVFIAWLSNEVRTPAEMSGMEEVARLFDGNKIVLVTSVLSRVETLYGLMTKEAENKYIEVLSRPNLDEIEVHRDIAQLAHEIRSHYKSKGKKTPTTVDAIHIATAIWAKVDELHTFDGCGKQPGMITLNGDEILNGLKIMAPNAKQPTLGF